MVVGLTSAMSAGQAMRCAWVVMISNLQSQPPLSLSILFDPMNRVAEAPDNMQSHGSGMICMGMARRLLCLSCWLLSLIN